MGKKIYLVRHCQANGQELTASLTEAGINQSLELVEFFADVLVERIISSPYHRAIDSVTPLAKEKDIPIEIDDRLSERVLSTTFFHDWRERLEQTFDDLDLVFEGGESSAQAMRRGIEVIKELLENDEEHILLATHGGLTSLILKYFQPSFRFKDWENLTNPDVFVIAYSNGEPEITRLWK
ncbi:histidine phosphatase family protein [Ornithinibacillus sp. FSL M8-0202]|uniref:histidine phosphatase family protein n=1 Tax=unclassified Ornithinibacillus TaxID=2620869 RepID=UPI0030CCDE3F